MQGKGTTSICIDCENSCGLCSWSANLTPVKGWEAKPVKKIISDGMRVNSWRVTKCPKFAPAERKVGVPNQWRPEDDEKLREMLKQKCRRKDMAYILKRSLNAIDQRIGKLKREKRV